MLDQRHPNLPNPASDENTYTLGSIGGHKIVIACLPKGTVGTNEAAIVAAQMLSTFPSIKIGLMVGIGGGVPPKVRLGDVVVGTKVIQWDFGKAEKNGTFRRTSTLERPPRALRAAISRLETEHDMREAKISQYLNDIKVKCPKVMAKYGWSKSLQDPLFAPDNSDGSQSTVMSNIMSGWPILVPILVLIYRWIGHLKDFLTLGNSDRSQRIAGSTDNSKPQRKPGDVRIHYGLIASGNQVLKDAKLRDNINESLNGDVLCVEMEAAGLTNFPYLVIRGICDYADAGKNDDWQEYAALIAAAYGKELLENIQPSDVDGEHPIKEMLSQVYYDVAAVRSKLDGKEDIEILNWLTPIDYGPRQSDYLRRRQPGTGEWLLASNEYNTWLEHKHVLFCPGIPGAGKTILTSIVIDNLTTRFSSDLTVGIAYVYCNFKRSYEQKFDDLLKSLLKQLAEQCQHSLPSSVKELHNKHRPRRTQPSYEEIVQAIRSVIKTYSRVFVIIDAVDEYPVSNGRLKFLSELFHLHDKYGANIFATSRFIPEITETFKRSTTLESSAILEIRAHDEDIRKYLDEQISQTGDDLFEKYREHIKNEITNAARGM
ncbi:hypothetical protein TWF696_006186 [Orbilia brochopaga]|uniref:Nucleoside phosphorylase domain-containing protein n=1 Tax=Orbilia brochopaga TaxID=3140254 RepID=A0AAV9UZE6_9PEZI